MDFVSSSNINPITFNFLIKKKYTMQHLHSNVHSHSFTLPDKEARVQFCKSAQEIKALACYNGCRPPANLFTRKGTISRARLWKSPKTAPINLPIVSQRSKDRSGCETRLRRSFQQRKVKRETSYRGGGTRSAVEKAPRLCLFLRLPYIASL